MGEIIMRYRYLSAVLGELMIFAAAAAPPALGNTFEGDVELLKKAALLHKANFDSLLTWKGQATEEITGTGGGRPDYLARNKITFAYDQMRNAVRWNKDPQEFKAGPGAENYATEADHQSNMIIGDKSFYYSWTGQAKEDGARSYDLIVSGPEDVSEWKAYAFHFNVRWFFAHPVSDYPGDEELMRMYDIARKPKEEMYDEKTGRRLEGQVKQEGDLVILEVQLTLDTEGNKAIYRDVYDLSRGGNLIECHNANADGDYLYTYEYEEKAGIWVPKSSTRASTTKRSNGEYRRLTRTVKWDSSAINVPFAEDEFTLAKMGMRPGDQIHDRRVGLQRYTYTSELADSNLLDSAHLPTDDLNGKNETKASGVSPPAQATQVTSGTADGNVLATGKTTPNAGSRAMPSYLALLIIAVILGVAGGIYAITRRKKGGQPLR
jgi:hypothetical protein